MKRNVLAMISMAILAALPFIGEAASPSRSSFSAPRASAPSVSRPSATSLYSKPTISAPVTRPTSSGGYSKPPVVASQPAPAVKTSGGYTKPTTTATMASSGGYTKPASTVPASNPKTSPSTGSNQTAFAKGNRFDQDTSQKLQREKAAASLAAYNKEKAQFKAPPAAVPASTEERKKTFSSNPVFSSAKKYGNVGYDDVQVRRTRSFGSWHTPVYVYNMAPSYGSWNSTFLTWALWNDMTFGYHHYNDPGYMAWHADAVRQAEQNGELKARLAEMDRRVAELQQANTPRNGNYLPSQVAKDPLVALSSEAIESMPVKKPLLRVATGIVGGRYNQVGELLKKKLSNRFDLELIVTSGSAENLELIKSDKVDAAIIQSDTDFVEKKSSSNGKGGPAEIHRATLYSEYVMLVVGKDSPIHSVNDLNEKTTLYVGPEGSGTAITWNGLVMQDDHYKGVKVHHLDYKTAFERVAENQDKALLFVAGQKSPLMMEAANTGKYRMVPVDDTDLTKLVNSDGHQVYDNLVIPVGMYPGMQSSDLKTLAVDAVWALSDDWIEKFGDSAFDSVNYAVIDVISDLHMHAGNPVAKQSDDKSNSGSTSHWFRNTIIVLIVIAGVVVFVTKANIIK